MKMCSIRPIVNRGQYDCRTLWGEHERVFVLNIRSAGKKKLNCEGRVRLWARDYVPISDAGVATKNYWPSAE